MVPLNMGLHYSRGTLQSDNGQMPTSAVEADLQCQPCAGTAAYQRPRLGTQRATRPPGPRFEPWATVGGKPTAIDLVGRFAAEPCVWAEFVVPLRDLRELTEKRFASIRHERQAREQAFYRQDDSFHHCDRAVLADGTVTWSLDALAFAPFSKAFAVKLLAAVANDVARCLLGLGNCASQDI
jgi:hypothetical protein